MFATTVCDGFGKFCGGVPFEPTNTMFHTDPFQPPLRSELRVRNCCWEPETVTPSIRESAIRPPLAQPSPPFHSCTWPERCIRRYGAACD
ncbi:hypothetical protein ACFQ1S_19460, partial [Kibdelosporangium lantanae]